MTTHQEAEHGEPLSFWRQYIFSVDHKMIAKQYLILGLVMALIGGLTAYLIRAQLAWPEKPLPVIGVSKTYQEEGEVAREIKEREIRGNRKIGCATNVGRMGISREIAQNP